MANATAITVHTLTPNALNAQPAPDVLDTGTSAVTLAANVQGRSDLILLEVTNKMGTGKTLTVTVAAGDNPPAARAGLGNLEVSWAGATDPVTQIIGPLEVARFIQDDGTIQVTFAPPASTTIAVDIRCYKLPKAV